MKCDRLLLDANVLLLWVVGIVSRDYIPHHKRLEAFSGADFDLLQEIVTDAKFVVTTPNAWTETANIVSFGVRPPLSWLFHEAMGVTIQRWLEVYQSSTQVVRDHAFMELGLSDVALLLSIDQHTTLLTTDAPLYYQALSRGHKVFNFHHLREERGLVG